MRTTSLVPVGLRTRGKALWSELTAADNVDAATRAIAGEACRIADRLDDLDAVIGGRKSGVRAGDLTVIQAMSEARLQANALRQLVAQLRADVGSSTPVPASTDDEDEPHRGGLEVADIAAARAARGRPTSDRPARSS